MAGFWLQSGSRLERVHEGLRKRETKPSTTYWMWEGGGIVCACPKMGQENGNNVIEIMARPNCDAKASALQSFMRECALGMSVVTT